MGAHGNLTAATMPNGYKPDRMKLLQRLSRAAQTRELRIGVFGNSITLGVGCPGGSGRKSKNTWTSRLPALLKRMWSEDVLHVTLDAMLAC
eukprot:6921351-Pyramimonas_sp.AAC.1